MDVIDFYVNVFIYILFFFFFSSRRRHTRWNCDWSSDVCSSDLDLATLQKELPPLGGLNATPVEKLAKLFISPGPIYDPEGAGRDWWRTARGLFAGGFRAGDRVANTFAYHFTPAGSMMEAGARAIGCTVVPAGTGQTEMQVAAIRDLQLSGYVGTPSFLKLIVEKADELKVDISCLKKAH